MTYFIFLEKNGCYHSHTYITLNNNGQVKVQIFGSGTDSTKLLGVAS
jgi:hypothetical protein